MSSQKTILVVDDDARTRAALSQLLTMEGYTVVTAANGREALGVVADANPDLVLSDVRMPRMGGDELAVALQVSQGPPVILMTAHDLIDAEEAAHLGAVGLFRKPIEIDEVFDRIAAVLD